MDNDVRKGRGMKKAYCTTNLEEYPGSLPLYVLGGEDVWVSAGTISVHSLIGGNEVRLMASAEEWSVLKHILEDIIYIRDNVYVDRYFGRKAAELLRGGSRGLWIELRGEGGVMREIPCERQEVERLEIEHLEEILRKKKSLYAYRQKHGPYSV